MKDVGKWGLRLGVLVVLRGLFAAAAMGILFWQWHALLTAPPRASPAEIALALAPGEARLLGRRALAAPAASAVHVRILRDLNGAWWITNLSDTLEVELRRSGRDELLRSAVLEKGNRFSVGQHVFEVADIRHGMLTLRDPAGKLWLYDGATLSHEEGRLPHCPSDSRLTTLRQVLRGVWNLSVPQALQIRTALELGGHAACGNRIALPELERRTASISRDTGGRYILRAGPDKSRWVCLDPAANASCLPEHLLYAQSVSLDDATRLVVGRTSFALALEENHLLLRPVQRTALLDAHAAPMAEDVSWHMLPFDPWRWPQGAAPVWLSPLWILAVALGAAMLQWRNSRLPASQALLLALAAVLVATSMLAYLLKGQMGHGWFLLLETMALGCILLMPGRDHLNWSAFALAGLLLAMGLAAQMALGLTANDTGGLRYFQSGAALMAASLAGWLGIATWFAAQQRRPRFAIADRPLIALAFLALSGLLLQAILGDETGVFGVQPVELAKLALVLLSAHVLALRLHWDSGGVVSRLALWLRFALPVMVFVALMTGALLWVHDYSPLLLLVSWLVGMAFAWSLASGRALGFLLALLLVGMAGGALGYFHTGGIDTLRGIDLYLDRLEVWLEPILHPHSGEQFRRGIELMTGIAGIDAGTPWRLPAVQDDFAPAWWIGRFGVWGGISLLALQLLYVGILLSIGWRWLKQGTPGDFHFEWLTRWLYFSLWGGAFLLLGHFAVSWGSNLGWLPVMGQPMPFLSAAGSLLIFLLAPLQALLSLPRQ